MIARNVTRDELQQAAAYAGVDVDRSLRANPKGRGFMFTLAPVNGRYQRRGHTGRRVHAVCYHGHFAFMDALYRLAPDAVLITAMQRYDGAEDFRRKAGAVAERNIGSMMQPLDYGDACDCEDFPCAEAAS